MTLTAFMKNITVPIAENTTPPKSHKGVIYEGQRNSTLSHRAGQLLKKYGDTEQARAAFMEYAGQCSSPLEQGELDTIYKSAQGFLHNTVEKDPGYIPPELYTPNIWALPVVDPGAMTVLCADDPKTRKFSIAAARLFLRAFGITIKINDMSKRVDIEGLPPEYNGEDACNLLETLISDAANALAFKRASSPIIHEILAVIANENRYHPVLELIKDAPHDGIDRVPEVCRMGDIRDPFHIVLFHKWALQTVAVLHNAPEKPIAAQGAVVLQGAQGIGKTEFFRHLAIRDEFFKDGATLDTTNKDSLMSAIKVWICELGEIDATTKKEQSAVKAFMTAQTDRFREPYARCESIRPRRTSFCGTVNPKGYLRDETGNRRYWTIPVEHIDLDAVFGHSPEWYTQFWRQIYAEYIRDPKGYLLTREEQDKLNGRNAAFEADVYGEDEFMTLYDLDADTAKWEWRTAAQIANDLNERFKSLNIRSESIGQRLLPRIEKRVGKTFERKINKGRRLILCPPKTIQGYNDGDAFLTEEEIEPLKGGVRGAS